VVKARFIRVLGDSEAAGAVALGVGIDDQDLQIIGGEGGCEVDGGSGFPYSAFLIGDREYSAQAKILPCCFT
jgi:hypothetical protein